MQINIRKTFIYLIPLLISLSSWSQIDTQKLPWKKLFNGKDLSGWDIKITGSELNTNYKNTFKIEDGVLKANYAEYTTFQGEYGHLYYQTPYSHYKLRIEYRFTGNQTPGGESWNVRNSGVMIHSQSAQSVGKDQSFPVSLEVQFLGGLSNGQRPTANLCTPGTTVEYQNKTILEHIINSTSKTYDGDQWVTVDVVVLGDSVIHHIIGTDTVLTYFKPKVGGGFVHKDYTFETAKVANAQEWIQKDNTPLTNGYIALQAESHPIEFRKVELQVFKEFKEEIYNNESVIVTKINDVPPMSKTLQLASKFDRLIVYLNDGKISTTNKGKVVEKKINMGDCQWIPKNEKFVSQNMGADYLSFYQIELKPWPENQNKKDFPALDPVKIDPKHYVSVLENDKVRAVLADFPPGAQIPMHEHASDRVIIFLTDHPLKLTQKTGESFQINDKAGKAFFTGGATHAEENNSPIQVKTIFVDLKKK